jgi:hypothetical protein
MKKMIIVLAAGIISTAAIAQKTDRQVPPAPPAPSEMKDVPPAPPPPPVIMDMQAPPPTPPAPPKPPKKHFATATNNKGYRVKIMTTENDNIILLSKNGVTQKIKMSVWNAKPQYFENKYGMLPPPPPPPPSGME